MAPMLNWLLSSRCSHQFTWPRRAADGSYYQACVLCGELYAYDWTHMRRTRPKRHREAPQEQETPRTPGWKPRARRLVTCIPAKYRSGPSETWKLAIVENVSKTGVLLRGALQFGVGDLIEVVFEMPAEIAGHTAEVSCAARAIRLNGSHVPQEQAAGPQDVAALAIIDYVFTEADEKSA